MSPASAANDPIQDQIEHSSYMRLLAALRFKNPSSKISTASIRPDTVGSDMHYLETIAVCMVTDQKGDVVASGLFRKSSTSATIVLARNDAAIIPDDEIQAKEFLEKLKSSRNRQLQDLMPFLVDRGKTNIQKRIDKLAKLTNDLKRGGMLISVIDEYCRREGSKSLQSELRDRGQHLLNLWKSAGVKLSDLQEALEKIVDILAKGLILQDDDKDTYSSFELFASAAATLSDSFFFEELTKGSLFLSDIVDKEIVKDSTDNIFAKFWRNLDKMRPYLRVPDLMKFIQGFSEVDIAWVPEDIASPTHVKEMNAKRIVIPNVLNVALKLAKQSIKHNRKVQNLTINELEEKFRSWNPFWVNPKNNTTPYTRDFPIRPKLHAEIQIILHLSAIDITQERRPVGCSKRSCLQCEITMGLLDGGRWMTAGAHAWPYETAALIGSHQCDTELRKIVKDHAIDGVKQLLGVVPARPILISKNSEEYVTASGSSGSENESESDLAGGLKSLKQQGRSSRK